MSKRPITLEQLAKLVNEQMDKGHGDALVCFDSEARQFEAHLIGIDSAFYQEHEGMEPLFVLHFDHS